MARLSKEQRKERRKQRRIKKALKSYRFRTLKNFLIWLGGLISSVIITVGVIALCLAVIPISTFTGGEKNNYVSEKVANNTLLNVIMNIQDYDMSDIPIVADSLEKMIKDAGIDEYVEIDTAKMKTLKFDETFTNELKSCVKVVATLESINGLEMLGDIGKLNVFTEWEEIEVIEGEESLMPELDGDGNIAREEGEGGALKANPKMYYYKVENGSEGGAEGYSEGIEGDNAVYERAFDDNGVKVAGYEGGTLYFPAVAKISILDAVQVLGESFGRVQIVNLLENFGAGELTDSMIGKVLSGKRIRDMASINANEILLADVLNYDLEKEENNNDSIKQLFDILIQAVESDEDLTPSNVTVGHLTSGFNVNGINLDVVLEEDSNASLYKILRSAIGLGETDAITIGNLSGIKPENIALESVLTEEENAKLYDILNSIIPEPADKEKGITIGDLSSINADNLNNLSLGVVMPEVDSPDLYKILRDATGIESGDITIADLKNIGSDFNIRISTVMTLEDSLMTMICDAINAYRTSAEYSGDNKGQTVNKDTVTIQDLGELKPDYIKLTSVLPCAGNEMLYKILIESKGETWTDEKDLAEKAAEIIVSDININTENVKILTVMPSMDEGTLDIIRDSVNTANAGKAGFTKLTDNTQLTIGHIADFSIDCIKLTTVIKFYKDDATNVKMWKLLLEGSGKDITGKSDSELEELANTMTVDDLKLNIDQVKLTTVMPYVESDNGVMYDMLSEATNTPIDKLTMATLSGKIDVDKVHLAKVMPSVDSHLKSILADAFMNTYDGDDYKTDGVIDKEKVFKAITIGDLSTGFSVNSIRLKTVVENPPEDLEALMEEMMQDDYSNITVSALSTFELTNVSLKTVLGVNEENGSTGNDILDALVAADAKVGGLADKINTLSLYDIYGKKCFVTLADLEERGEDTTQIVDLNYKFKRVDNTFVHITDQEIIDDGIGEDEIYYIHKDDGIWLLLCFEAEGFNDVWNDADGDGVKDFGEVVYDADGRPEKFVISDFSVATLGDPTKIKDVLTNARMQQFVDAGIFDSSAVNPLYLKLPLSLIISADSPV